MAKLPLKGLATLVICLAFLVTAFQEVPATTADPRPSNPPDSDGKVPIKSVCYDPRSEEAWFHRVVYDYAPTDVRRSWSRYT
jgi:hypothetical protein